jgi:lamin tail-like protein
LERIGARIYGADKDGTVVVSTDGTTYKVMTADTGVVAPSIPVAAMPSAPSSQTATSAPTAVSSAPLAAQTPNPCHQRVDPSQAPNQPIIITAVDKGAEVVTISNIGTAAVDLSGWTICSLLGSQRHAVLDGTLAPGERRSIPSQSGRAIWNNRSRERAAVYNGAGQLISYWSEGQS